MSDSFSDERADMASKTHYVDAQQGVKVELVRNDMYIKVRDGSGAISITTTPPSSVPIGLCMTFDNSGGSGTLNVNAGEVQVPPGLVYEAKVVGDGAGGHALVVVGPAETPNTLTTVALLQSAIDSDKENGRLLNLQVGETTLTETLVIDGGTGGALRGQGIGNVLTASNPLLRQQSKLVYAGTKASGEAAIRYERSEFSIENVMILGKATADIIADTGTRTPVGLAIRRSAEGSVGTGKLMMENVLFSGFDVCIDVAADINDANCDTSYYRNVAAHKSGTFMRVNNIQGMTYRIDFLRAPLVDVVFDFISGGKFHLDVGLITSNNTLLRFNGNTGEFGHNNAQYHVNGYEWDSAARNAKVLDMEAGAYYADILVTSPWWQIAGANTWQNYAFRPADNTTLTIRDAVNLQAGMIAWNCSSTHTVIVVDNCKAWTNVTDVTDLFDLNNSLGSCRVIVRDLKQYGTNVMLTDEHSGVYDEVLVGNL